MIEIRSRQPAGEIMSLPELDSDRLPLVTITVGDAVDEFESLYAHLETISRDSVSRVQSLIVAREEMPDMLYNVLRARTRQMPNVYIRRLGDDVEDCAAVLHQTGRFYVTCKQRAKRD